MDCADNVCRKLKVCLGCQRLETHVMDSMPVYRCMASLDVSLFDKVSYEKRLTFPRFCGRYMEMVVMGQTP
jgi:hypothetical protein